MLNFIIFFKDGFVEVQSEIRENEAEAFLECDRPHRRSKKKWNQRRKNVRKMISKLK